jgi:hypothetical protein
MNMNENFTDIDKLAWGLFSKTGKIGYYSLSKRLEEDGE